MWSALVWENWHNVKRVNVKPNLWPVCSCSESISMKVSQIIEDYLMRFKKNSVEPFYREIQKSAKSQNLEESCT